MSLLLASEKPLSEAMGEVDIVLKSGASKCMAKMVELVASHPITSFQKLFQRADKQLSSTFLTKASPFVSYLLC